MITRSPLTYYYQYPKDFSSIFMYINPDSNIRIQSNKQYTVKDTMNVNSA